MKFKSGKYLPALSLIGVFISATCLMAPAAAADSTLNDEAVRTVQGNLARLIGAVKVDTVRSGGMSSGAVTDIYQLTCSGGKSGTIYFVVRGAESRYWCRGLCSTRFNRPEDAARAECEGAKQGKRGDEKPQ